MCACAVFYFFEEAIIATHKPNKKNKKTTQKNKPVRDEDVVGAADVVPVALDAQKVLGGGDARRQRVRRPAAGLEVAGVQRRHGPRPAELVAVRRGVAARVAAEAHRAAVVAVAAVAADAGVVQKQVVPDLVHVRRRVLFLVVVGVCCWG